MTQLIVARGQSPLQPADTSDDVNLLYNGKFDSALIGLDKWFLTSRAGTTWVQDFDTPITAPGSVKVTITDDIGGLGIYQHVNLLTTENHNAGVDNTVPSDFAGQTWRLTFDYKGEDIPLITYMDYDYASDDDSGWTGTATENPQSALYDFVIPAFSTRMDLSIFTSWDGGNPGTWWLDNIKLVKIAAAP